VSSRSQHPESDPPSASSDVSPIFRALQENEDWYRDLVEHSQDLLCIHDLQGRLLSVNPSPARLLGYTVEELLKIPMREIIAPEFRAQFDAYLSQIVRTGESHGLMRVIGRSGERRIWEYHNTLRTEGVQSPIVRGMAHDVTDQKRAEIAFRQSEERFRVALDKSPIRVFNQDRDLRYTWAHNLKDGWKPQDFLGKTDEEIFNAENAVRLTSLKRRAMETHQGARDEMSITVRGKTYHCDLTIEPMIDAAGQVLGITCACMDVTHLHDIAEELRVAKEKLAQEKLYLEQEIDTELGFGEIVGQSEALKTVMEQVAYVAPSDSTVLLLGETGTGKELIARAIHRSSKRSDHAFIKMNCAAIPSGLLESELFGHERGAFTGAVGKRIGRLELADKGTLFLDEVGEIPLALQPKLLRVLQDQEFERLGGTQTLKINFRLIAATNRDLHRSVDEQQFRSDLYYRLNVFPIRVPPLREGREDIRLLVEHFVQKNAKQMKKQITSIPRRTMDRMMQWDWPGNIRELENFVERSVILSRGSTLDAPVGELEVASDGTLVFTLEDVEREHILRVLRQSGGRLAGVNGAAARLGLARTTLQSKLKHLGIDHRQFRS
jgi:PAS domain S-box-containing protein